MAGMRISKTKKTKLERNERLSSFFVRSVLIFITTKTTKDALGDICVASPVIIAVSTNIHIAMNDGATKLIYLKRSSTRVLALAEVRY